MERLIDANKLTTEKICFYLGSGYASCADDIEHMINDAETIEAEPVVHAEWIPDPVYSGPNAAETEGLCDDDDFMKHYRCSRCGRRVVHLSYQNILKEYPYCHCGAKMEAQNG